MNLKQKEYAMARVESVKQQHIKKLTERFTDKSVILSSFQRLDLIRKGKVKLKSRGDLEGIDSWMREKVKHVFDFSHYEKAGGIDKVKMAPDLNRVVAEATRIKDEIMLGSEKEALALIQDFEKW